MNSRAGGAWFQTFIVLAWLFSVRSVARPLDQGYDIWFVGKVLAVDERNGLIRIARGPTETRDAAVIECTIVHHALRHIHRGMQIDVEADTRTTPWHILHLRPLEEKVRPLIRSFTWI